MAFKDFEALDNIERASFVLGCELWTENFKRFKLFKNSREIWNEYSSCYQEWFHTEINSDMIST